MKPFKPRITAICLIIAIIVVGLSSCHREKLGKVNIAYFPYIICLPIFVAQEKGFFDESQIGFKVNLTKVIDPVVMDQTLVSGSAEAGWAGMYDIFLMELRSPGKFKLAISNYTTMEKPLDYMLVHEKPGEKIEKLSDLNGKVIGRTVGAYSKLVMEMILKDEVDLAKTTLQEVPGTAMVQALISGQLDGLFAYEPLVSIALSQSDKIKAIDKALLNKKILDPFPNAAFVLSGKFLNDYPQSANKIIKALEDAIDYIRTNEEEARLVISKHTPIPEELAKKLVLVQCWKNDEVDLPVIQSLADKLRSPEGLTKKVDVSKIYYKVR